MHRLRTFHLFAGAGGGILSDVLLGHHPIGAVEINPYCQQVLSERQKDGGLPWFPIFGDVKEFDGKPWRGRVDIVTAGFPCQPFSYEGKRDYETSSKNLWPETSRVIQEIKPRFVLLENVPGIRKYLPVVVRDLRRNGYTVERPITLSSAAAGAIQIRERVWILAHTDGTRRFWERHGFTPKAWPWTQTWAELERLVSDVLQSCIPASRGSGIHDGIAYRMDRLRSTGNMQDPRVAALAFMTLYNRINN